MPDTLTPPEACTSMIEVRAGVDMLDARLVEMLAIRFAYMRAAARIKPERGQVRDEPRKAQVIANAKAKAEQLSLPGDLIAKLWDDLVESSIAYELNHWDERQRE